MPRSEPNVGRLAVKGDKAALARAAMTAVEPLVELMLELGITSPEAESLLRSLFVHKAKDWLRKRYPDQPPPSDVRLALVTGVHRNFIRRILQDPPKIAPSRATRGHRAERLLQAWHTDPQYLDSSGRPRDLPEKGPAPSFEDLVQRCVPGVARGLVLDELEHAGSVRQLGHNRLRVSGRRLQPQGPNIRNLAEFGRYAKFLYRALVQEENASDDRLYVDEMPSVEIDRSRLRLVGEIMRRRSGTFLSALEHEISAERHKYKPIKDKGAKVGFLVIQTIDDCK